VKLSQYIDLHKGVTFLAILALMAFYRQWDNPTAWVYLALHGTYGQLWVLKSRLFPDKNWEHRVSVWYGVLIAWGGLTLYWFPAWLVNAYGVQAPPWLPALAISLFSFGIFFHFAADMQKYTQLKLQPDRLITDGLFARVRNINYFGEFLVYFSFALLAVNWLAFIPLAIFIVFYWVPNMRRKERSLARYPEFTEYKRRTKWFIPYIF